jgi:flagellar M-ring protein FliF
MPPQLQGLLASVRRTLAGFSTGQKAVLGVAVVGVLLGAFAFTSWAAKPSYAALYTDLEASDAAAITEQLDARGTSFELADGGRTVLVPRSELYQLRLDMSAAGLPEGGTQGYALLDEQGITASEFRQRVDYQRALEGELTRTIGSIDGVEAAKVHLVIPEEDLFSDDERQPTASVLLRTGAGKRLGPGQVQSIVHLVSSSVEGLVPEQVTVADADGTMLAAPGEDGLTTAANDARSQQTAAFENDLSRSVQQLLEPVTGPGGAIVRVRADLDFDQRSTRTERYEPVEGLPPATESTSREAYTGTGAPVGGVLGPDGLPIAPGAGESTYEKEQAQRANALNTVTEELETAPGQVRRMSVAVLLDGNAGPIDEQAVRQLVSAATLLDPERGDDLQVTTMAFDTDAADAAAEELAAAEAAERRAELMALGRTIAVVLLVALGLFLAYRSSRKQRREPLTLTDALALHAADDDLLDLDSEEGGLTAVGAARPALEPAAARRLEVHNEVAELVDRQPEEVAQLLRGWLADRRGA